MWCGNNYGTDVCDAYVGSYVEFEQVCSKLGHFHMWFCLVVKLCQFEIYTMYVDFEKQYFRNQF